ncbi:ROK family transcriptional regulator [Rhizobium alvei]|uniref:ROK family transcriptional regulator n=1 Tax=Rhizobium alvei TaxID=1132659 RepID=A0ABT8YP88_9HYPH|nr:ROK family transcriptional regulator [Rhizobium alvei]MDO6965494.1 ROK family transcriptional regulator [Rhizobium alvei]
MANEMTATALSGVAGLMGGANQTRVRAYNERLVLSLVRRHGTLSKAEIARHTGLSAQTVSVIMRALEQDGLLIRGEPRRGKVGQPSIPMSLNPDGVFSLGLKIGRRSADLILADFTGRVKQLVHEAYPYPTPKGVIAFAKRGCDQILASMTNAEKARIAGLGVALPFELWNWVEAVGAPKADMDAWRDADIEAMLDAALPFPVLLQNDATAACAAELAFGHGPKYSDFAYFFLGSFIGGGVVLNHALYPGRTGNAGAFGSMPFTDAHGLSGQLIDHASVVQLEKMLIQAKKDPSSIWMTPENWDDFGATKTEWIAKTGETLAYAAVTVCSVIDFEAVIIDGGFSADIRREIVDAARRSLERFDLQGIERPMIEEGLVGSSARAIGAASLPLFSRYHIDQSVLLKEMT